MGKRHKKAHTQCLGLIDFQGVVYENLKQYIIMLGKTPWCPTIFVLFFSIENGIRVVIQLPVMHLSWTMVLRTRAFFRCFNIDAVPRRIPRLWEFIVEKNTSNLSRSRLVQGTKGRRNGEHFSKVRPPRTLIKLNHGESHQIP